MNSTMTVTISTRRPGPPPRRLAKKSGRVMSFIRPVKRRSRGAANRNRNSSTVV